MLIENITIFINICGEYIFYNNYPKILLNS